MMRTVLVTGVSGFVGEALVASSAEAGWKVIGIDNGSTPGNPFPPSLPAPHEAYAADINDIDRLPLPDVDAIVHCAAQTTVTRSFTAPWADFYANACGTLRLVLWARDHCKGPFIYASTNKVYGTLTDVRTPVDVHTHLADPCTPYGVSKWVGEAYLREIIPDRARIFRQSCLLGPLQRGREDQGWVAYLRRCAHEGRPVTCYGDGTQVRDLLWIDDLLRLYWSAVEKMVPVGTYTIGGGEANACSFADVLSWWDRDANRYAPWRPGDQRYFVSANEAIAPYWKPAVSLTQIRQAFR